MKAEANRGGFMFSFKRINLDFLVFRLFLLAFSLLACDPTRPTPIRIVGRLAFPDAGWCTSAIASHNISWSECHALKRHFSASTGAAVRTDSPEAGALRPIRATVELKYLKEDLSGAKVLCSRRTIQTDLDGFINVPVDPCNSSLPRWVVGRVYLQYRIPSASGRELGIVRGIWRQDQSSDLFGLTGDDVIQEVPSFTEARTEDGREVDVTFAIPQLAFTVPLGGAETLGTEAAPATINLGTRVFLATGTGLEEDQFGYMSQVLSAFNTMIELHDRLRLQKLAAGKESEYFDRIFGRYAPAHYIQSYTIWFDNTWAFGWDGGIALYRPDLERFRQDGDSDGSPDGSWGSARLLSGVEVLSHEFGHSIQGAFAPMPNGNDYRFANPMRTPDNNDYDWGHAPGQFQDMGVAYVEGSASTLGQFLVNGCNRAIPDRRPWGGLASFGNHMFSGNSSCDMTRTSAGDFRNGCGYHHFRWHMNQRGIAPSSAEFATRATRLRDLTNAALAVGHGNTKSNDEGRYAEFGCDLLDTQSDVSHASATAGGRYVENYTYEVGQILNGIDVGAPTVRPFSPRLSAENVSLTLEQFLDTMANFCADCVIRPLTLDLVSSGYAEDRLKAYGGRVSPQTMSRYIVTRGYAGSEPLRNLLQSNFMETSF
jgi:hypothetical protein